MKPFLGAVTALILFASSTALAADPPRSGSRDDRVERPHLTLLVTGAAIGVGTYGITASVAATGKRAADRDLFVPVIGPFINLSNRNCAGDCVTDTADLAALWASAGLQLIGVGMMVTSAFVPERAGPAPRPQDMRLLNDRSTTTLTSASLAPATTSALDRAEEPRERRPHRALLWTGVSVLGATYAGSVVAGGVAGDRVPDKNLFVPIVGPWLDLGQRDCDHRPCDPGQEAMFKSLIIASGVLQGGAAAMTVSSFFVSEKSEPSSKASDSEVRVVPISYAGGGGIGVVGLF